MRHDACCATKVISVPMYDFAILWISLFLKATNERSFCSPLCYMKYVDEEGLFLEPTMV